MPILNLDEFAPQEEPVQNSPQAGAPLNLDEVEATQAPQSQVVQPLNLDAAPVLVPPQGEKAPSGVQAATVWDTMLEPYLRANRQLAGGILDVPRYTMRSLGGVGKAADVLQQQAEETTGLPSIGVPIAGSLSGLLKLEKWLDEKGTWVPQEENQNLVDNTFRGLGQASAFMLGGYAGAVNRLPAWMVPSGMGALVSSGAMQMDAEMHKATPEQEGLALIGGALLGTTEGLPYGYFLNKINKATGGRLWESIQTVGGEGLDTLIRNTLGGTAPPNALWELVKGGLLEATQEGFQTVGENVIAREVAGYDPERSPGEGFWDAVLAGGATGAILGGGIGVYSRQKYLEKKAQDDALMADLKRVYPDINSIGGPFSPLSIEAQGEVYNLLAMSHRIKNLEAAFDQNSDQALQDFLDAGELPKLDTLLGVDPDRQRLDYNYSHASSAGPQRMLNQQTDPKLNASGGNKTVLDAIQEGKSNIVVGALGHKAGEYQLALSEVGRLRGEIATLQGLLPQQANDPTMKTTTEDAIKRRKLEFKEAIRTKRALERRIKGAEKLVVEAGKLVQALDKIFKMPEGTRYVIDTEATFGKTTRAHMGRIKGVVDAAGNPINVHELGLNLNALLEDLYPVTPGKKAITKNPRKIQMLHLAETIMHEFGHAYQTSLIADMKDAYLDVATAWRKGITDPNTGVFETGKWITKPTLEAVLGKEQVDKAKTYMALVTDYVNFINSSFVKGRSFPEFTTSQRGLAVSADAERNNQGLSQYSQAGMARAANPNYTFSFDEYIAHRFERLYASGQQRNSGHETFVSRQMGILLRKNFFNKYHKAYADALKLLTEKNPSTGDVPMLLGVISEESDNTQALDMLLRKIVLPQTQRELISLIQEGGPANLIDAIKGKVPGLDARGWIGLAAEYDRFTRMNYLFKNLVQIARDNPHIKGLQDYFHAVADKWSPYSREIYSRATDTLHIWNAVGKESANKVTNVLMEETLQEEQLAPTELAKRLKGEELEVYVKIRNDLNHILSEMQRVHEAKLVQSLYGNQVALDEAMKESQETFNKMRSKGYFPFMRFGKYLLTVRSGSDQLIDGKNYKAGQLVSWESFDDPIDRKKAERDWQGKKLDLVTQTQMRSDSQYAVQGLPLPFLRSLKDTLVAGNADATVLKEIDQAINDNLPLHSFRRQFLRRRGIKGFSQDFMRSYAAYMRMSAAHISRIEFAPEMLAGIKSVEEELKLATYVPQASMDMRSRLTDWMKAHYDYVMNPQNELQALRAAGFFFHLGFNLKSAVLNFFQVPMVGLPYLGAKFGDVQALAALAKAQKDVVSYWKNRDEWAQGALSNEQRRLTYAIRGEQSQAGGYYFNLHGMSTYFDPNIEGAKFFDISKMRLFNTNEIGNSVKLIEARLRMEKRELVPNKDLVLALEEAIKEFQATSGPVTNEQFGELDLEKALTELGVDGVIMLEDLDLAESGINTKGLRQYQTTLEVEKAFSNGDRVFELSEQDERLEEIRSTERIRKASADTLFVLPKGQELALSSGEGTTVYVSKSLDKAREINRQQFNKRMLAEKGSRKGDVVRMLEHLKKIGVTDQSLAMELAIAASENKADRLAPLNTAERWWYNISEYGALPFHVAEKLNRNIMAMASYNLARDNGMGHAQAVEEAKAAIRQTMYEYAAWNRPVALRGKKAALFLFMNYVVNTADFATQGNKAALRFWLITAMSAGLMGLPFAEDAEDMIDFVATKLNTWLGIKNPKFSLRQEMREYLKELEINPDLVLHGFGQQSFGLKGLSELTGIPMPSIDMAGSVGLGNVIPGTGIPEAMTRGIGPTLSAVVREGGGALGTTFEGMLGAALSDDPNEWKRFEKWMPTFMKNASQAARMWDERKVTTAQGQTVADFDPMDPRASLEIGAKALGFQPTRVSRGWERIIAEKEHVEFYRLMQAQRLKVMNAATYVKDREAMADARKGIDQYNSIVPYPEMKINADMIIESFERYAEKRALASKGFTDGEKNLRMQREIRGAYETP